ncbi:hypothetical protein VT85_07170 [Planctomyces sp. SH-PL62]|nr:hypothetical protein VT85_07170 [Planctomyces sp. SH-PL62]
MESLERQLEAADLLADDLTAPSLLDADAQGEELARAGLATRAFGFLIGLGLATGPLYPDLIAFARKKLFRKSRPSRRRASAGKFPAYPKSL